MEEEGPEPLGARSRVVDIEQLTKWNLTQLPEYIESIDSNSGEEVEISTPFPWRSDLNSKVLLWCGDITLLNVEAIVHSTSEKFHNSANTPTSEEIYENAGPELLADLKNNIRVCKTGEAKLTKGYKLLARYIIHTVGPRYNIKYVTAAESALYSCYRYVLRLVRETSIKSVALTPAHSSGRGYPPEDGAHIAIRTVRRFLEKFGDEVETIVFHCTENDMEVYEKVMPLYFPRSSKEEAMASCMLPENVGNEDGEPIIAERQIRIMDKPAFASMRCQREEFEETVDLNKEFATSTVQEVGKHPFAQMEENPDDMRKSAIVGKTTDEQRILESRRRYERLMKRAKTEDLTDIAALKCLYRTGVDKFGRPVVIYVGKHFPGETVNLEKALLYMLRVMEPVVESDFVVVYLHTQTNASNHPPMNYLRQVYSLLDHKYKKNLKAFYIVHPTWWSKLATWFFTTFTASDIKNKVFSLKGVQYLYRSITPDQIEVPFFVTNYGIQINGPRYYEPPEDGQEGL
ncbi:protein GDAP2 homolog [Mizuhopecten yessoensis]|uniref:Protein GDAP2-like n=1 Tax=Mizuhopecten yessoensis TaxID=6573 RepID=A0A210QSE4_MIZYE|nr:protein GDAP2 homolog [Mizuhopecten yessoensis]OWF51677.1 Protein GDAP2-like [Mizuhopecten yessoensis]